MNYLIKDALDSQYEICDYLQNMTIDLGFPDFNDEMSFKDLVHLNLSRFLFFLAGQDDKLSHLKKRKARLARKTLTK